MWKRKELKNKARKVVYKNYWTAIVVCFLIALLTGEFGTSTLGIWQSEDSMDPNYIINHEITKIEVQNNEIKELFNEKNIRDTLNETQFKIFQALEANLNSVTKTQKYIFKIWDAITYFNIHQTQLGVLLCLGAVIAFAFTVFIADPLIVGGKKYFLKARNSSNTKIGVIGEIFQKEHWLNISITMFLRNVYNALWYLTIVGGILKTYEYRMIPYILAENPNIKRKEAFKLSKQMMKGNKWRTFILDISFFRMVFLICFNIWNLKYIICKSLQCSNNSRIICCVKTKSHRRKI